ncbi:MAG TPA: 5'-methylthioadenosine/S-adenosylhomocysteine nucleosidase [Streptosporangiaceae bacterium]
MNDVVVMLTALDLEYQAVREKLTGLRLHRHPAGTRFEVGRLDSGGRVALALVGEGNHPAAVLAERAIAEFAPAAVLFVGVAGALRSGISLGDLVVATHIYAYHGGTSKDDGLKARPRVWEIAHGVDQIARHLARTGEWAGGLRSGRARPGVHFGPIAAGEIVRDSVISEHARWVSDHYNDAIAIEMEAAGVAQAAHLNNGLPVIVVRGISDRADGSKAATDKNGWQPRAVANAAAFAVALAGRLVREQATARPAGTGKTGWKAEMAEGEASMARGNANIATGGARVGIQAAQIIGNVYAAPEPGPPPAESMP